MQANLEKQIKELNVRIVDLETKSLNHPRPVTTSRRLESRIEELTNQLNQSTKDSSRVNRSADKTARDARLQLAESERARARLEEEVKNYESKLSGLRHSMDELVCFLFGSSPLSVPECSVQQQTSENNLQLAKRRAEREAADNKQKALK